ncbi:MAG: phosphate ABC transporter permease PstA [Oscillatoriales cyanobacterium RM2_1_1]|nr:phosphate ABC transporter permease PstA [Oscillatoriales cyanobacterium SM2_3_0]NJO47748.1 phosphate ABC transporter permease PstA [Oscillatoriales cyanobacterium RM2_1_1]
MAPASDSSLDTFSEVGLALHQPLSPWRRIFSQGMTGLGFVLTGLALLPLFSIVWEIIRQGIGRLSWETLVSLPAPVGMEDQPNGIANAIVGTLVMVGLAALASVPLGVITGIFMTEVMKGTTAAASVRFIMVILSSVPTVILGVFAYGVLVLTTKTFSAVAGALALSLVMLPIVALTTEEALKLVPSSYRQASAALGGARFQTVFRIILPTALPAITTGALLAVARAAGETAPLMFTALFSQFWPEGLMSPTPSMSVLIYNYSGSPYKEQNEMAWTAALVLLFMVLISNILSRLVLKRKSSD